MLKESCSCPIEDLEKTIETISYRFLKNLGGEEVSAPESVVSREEPPYDPCHDEINKEDGGKEFIKGEGYKTSFAISVVSREEPSYKTLSVSQVQSMPNISIRKKKKWGFYGHSTINHDYNLKTVRGDKVVVDNATGLMWHQSGSRKFTKWKKAKEWIRKLNKSGYAGYHDWRLPTVEEAVSLLEPSKRNGLYIDPVFNTKQIFIWTGDRYGSEAAWGVGFGNGNVYSLNYYNVFFVRPVRFVE
jgi:hypothetical protein